ncbi:MAG TPA: hypothetical protein VFR56_04810 [Actinomycetes bacterium]|nr:hypothetical protein [Actinomycetes bacterium]
MTPARLLRCTLGAALLAAMVVLVPAGAAMACSCVEAPPDPVLLAESDVVFTGRLVERHDPTLLFGLSSSDDPAVLVFDVATVHKGSVAERQGIETARSGASCGLELTQGREALVFADRVDGHLSASLCGGSRELAAGEQPLGTGTGPRPGSSVHVQDGLRPVVAGAAGLAGLGLLAALSVIALRRRRRPVSTTDGLG